MASTLYYENRLYDARCLCDYLSTLTSDDHKDFITEVMFRLGQPRNNFYKWKYGNAAIPLEVKHVIEEVADCTIFNSENIDTDEKSDS